MYVSTSWIISDYIYDPLNYKLIFDYPITLNFLNNSYYYYKINSNIINNNDIYINKNQIYILNQVTISEIILTNQFIFTQIYISSSSIYKPFLNQVAQVSLIIPIQYTNNIYFIPFDKYGNDIGSKLYIITFRTNIYDTSTNFNLITSNLIFNVNILLWLSDNQVIIATNYNLQLDILYTADFGIIIYNVSSINFYQLSYQNATFYYQDNINYFYVFINENSNNFDFRNHNITSKYYTYIRFI